MLPAHTFEIQVNGAGSYQSTEAVDSDANVEREAE